MLIVTSGNEAAELRNTFSAAIMCTLKQMQDGTSADGMMVLQQPYGAFGSARYNRCCTSYILGMRASLIHTMTHSMRRNVQMDMLRCKPHLIATRNDNGYTGKCK